MAQEIKNTFLKSKMNKDLDDRILPNGEYRDALNISVGRSEDNDVGALENIIGNDLVSGTDIGNGLTIIGVHAESAINSIFVFLTNYTDTDTSSPTNAPLGSKHYIYAYNSQAETYTLLVKGEFLNFSTTNRIVGTNLLENLLFWTDNRNQPRKINVNLARAFEAAQGGVIITSVPQNDYYTEEHQISVAKYNPYDPIRLYNRINLKTRSTSALDYFEVSGDKQAELTPYIGATVVSAENGVLGNDYVEVTSVSFTGAIGSGITRINVSPNLGSGFGAGDYVSLIKSTMSSQQNTQDWPGDPDFLEDKFVRFSYRFKFDDNEYSIMAPFTQIAYIPKQKGFFINGDEKSAYQSTVVAFMENMVQNVGLVIPLPDKASRISSTYKISELEILFRESDGVAVKVLESVSVGEISGASGGNNFFNYDYQSRKPYRTLPEAQTVRVYDKVPVRALAQGSSGNRIIYGNYRDQHTPPQHINYNCRIAPKSVTGTSNNFMEYPNHSVKRNRNYQVGFVLSDKFGRQSPVILSSVDLGAIKNADFFSGSTIYSPYDAEAGETSPIDWVGDSIQVLVNEPILSEIDLASGTPGLYAIKQQNSSTGEGFAIADYFVGALTEPITNSTFTFTLNNNPTTGYPDNTNVPVVGDYMRGAYKDFVKVTAVSEPTPANQYVVTTAGRVNDIYLRTDNLPPNTPDLKFAYTINDLGWYSYKVVVKQTEQDYYNVYLPGILNGYPGQSGRVNTSSDPDVSNAIAGGIDNGVFPSGETNLTAHTVLFNDNINKIPRDLAEVGPDQKQYRSSVNLYGRVTNTGGINVNSNNEQYYPRNASEGKLAIKHTSTAIAQAKDFNMGYADLSRGFSSAVNPPFTGSGGGNAVFYQINTNPLIARISTTEKAIGATALNITAFDQVPSLNIPSGINMTPSLAVYETAPVESNLDIYWETTTAGLIVDLNGDIASTEGGVTAFNNVTWDFKEDDGIDTFVTPDWFEPINNIGEFVVGTEASLSSQTDGTSANVDYFELVSGDPSIPSEAGKYKIKSKIDGLVFTSNSATDDVFSFVITITTPSGFVSNISLQGESNGFGALQNIAPSLSGTVPSVSADPNIRVLLNPSDWPDPINGSILPGSSKQIGLRYSFEEITPGSIPSNWYMNPSTGKLTQAVPGDTGLSEAGTTTPEFEGNPSGVYAIRLKLNDASATNNNNISDPYLPLLYSQTINITLGVQPLNDGVVPPSCLLVGNTLENSLWSKFTLYNSAKTTQAFYVSADTLSFSSSDPNDSLAVSFTWQPIGNPTDEPRYGIPGPGPLLTPPIKIGNAPQSAGAISFSVNMYSPAGGNNSFSLNSVTIAYRTVPVDTSIPKGLWTGVTRDMEINNAGQTMPTTDNPGFGLGGNNPFFYPPPDSNNPPFVVENQSTDYWGQFTRAFDYSKIPTSHPIEWRVIVRQLQALPSFNPGSPRIWVTIDDPYNPSCAPRQGRNWVNDNPPSFNGRFRFAKSQPQASSVAFNDPFDTIPPSYVYADTCYGEYVREFFLTSNGEETYKPPEGLNYITYRAGIIPAGYRWTTLEGQNETLSFVAGFNSDSGLIIQNPNSTQGVNAVQVVSNSNLVNNTAGTFRQKLL
jgi:hypothetical protein